MAFSAAAQAQRAAPAAGAAASRDRYAAEPLVVERLDSVYRYNADGTGSKVDTNVVHPQTEAAARGFRMLSFPFSSGWERVEVVYVRVRKSDGTVITTPPAEAEEQPAPVTEAAPLYSDLHILRILVRGLAAGDRLEYQVRKGFTRAEAKDQFWGVESFGRGVVVLQRAVELRVPAGKEVLVSSPKDPARVSQEAGEKVYRWTGSQLTATVSEAGAPGRSALVPAARSEDDDRGNEAPPIAWTTFHSWAEVGSWYRSLAARQTAPTPALKAKADSIVYGLASPVDRIRALYRYVAMEIRSIDVSLGAGSFEPHAAEEVLQNQYGDSNDKNALLVALLRAENLPAATVLIGTGVPVDDAVPAPGWFDRVVTLAGAPLPGASAGEAPGGSPGASAGEAWLDSSPEIAPFRVLEPALRDRQALVIPVEGTAGLRRSPADLPFVAANHFAAKATLSDNGDLAAHVDVTLRGDQELRYREGFRNVSQGQWDRIAELYTRAESLPGQPGDTVADQVNETAVPLHLSFDLRQSPYGDWANFRVVPLEPGLTLPWTNRRTPPAGKIDFGGKRTETATSRITLPPGFSADLPPALHLRTPFARLDKTSTLEKAAEGQVLVTERTLQLSENSLPASAWPAYREFLDEAGRSEPWIQLLTGKAGGSGGLHPPLPGEDRPEAAELVQQANQAIMERDWATATARLDQAKGLNPRQAFLWSSYGFVASAAGKAAEAISDYERELLQHPDEAMVSRSLAAAQARGGDRAGAVKTLEAAVALNGRDEQTVRLLGALEAVKDVSAADKTLRAGLLATPDSTDLKLALGTVLLREAKREEGARLLLEVLHETQQIEQLNDAAYALGDASLALPEAEQASRRSVQMMNAICARDGGQEEIQAGLRHSQQLISEWDTYGWILYREGNTSEAEPWLRAAWADSFGAETGRHLAALLQKQGKAGEAEQVLQAAATRPHAALKPPVVPGAAAGLPAGELPDLASVGAKQTAQTTRSFPVSRPVTGPGRTIAGSAVFVLDYSLVADPRARFVRGDPGLGLFTEALARLNTHALLPPGSPAHLLREGVLECRAGGNCIFALSSGVTGD